MIYPTLRLLANQPQLLLEHAAAYGQLFSAELDEATRQWRRRLLLVVAVLVSASVCAVLGGIALMLGALMPDAAGPAIWTLVLVPLAPASLALACALALGREDTAEPFGNLKRQASDDLAMLGNAGRP